MWWMNNLRILKIKYDLERRSDQCSCYDRYYDSYKNAMIDKGNTKVTKKRVNK